ncbi:ACRO protein, partial [Paradoxornis webbianus]|nr:ACRO protein [Sinosuthora webbiana]
DTSRWKVVMGATDLAQPGPESKESRIKRVLKHKRYDQESQRNNIALVQLEQPVECSDYIQLGCVPDSSLEVSELKTCYIAGWRATPDSELPLPIRVSLSRCPFVPKAFPLAPQAHPALPITPRCGCDPAAAPVPSLLAQGDIGGPLVCKDNDGDYFWLVGLAGWGKGCAGDKRPGVFTSTQHFHRWIQRRLGLLPP